MKWSVYQHWDPLRVCAVGRSYPPEFYSWITVPHVRELFEKIARETEEDYQGIIQLLEKFGVEVLRPDLPTTSFVDGCFIPPPMTPRDYTVMIGDTFYYNSEFTHQNSIKDVYNDIRDPSWPDCTSEEEFKLLPEWIQQECLTVHNFKEHLLEKKYKTITAHGCYDKLFDRIKSQGNKIKENFNEHINGAMIARIGRDLYFGTETYTDNIAGIQTTIDQEFVNTRNHIVNTGGHGDGTYCPVCPGLIISL